MGCNVATPSFQAPSFSLALSARSQARGVQCPAFRLVISRDVAISSTIPKPKGSDQESAALRSLNFWWGKWQLPLHTKITKRLRGWLGATKISSTFPKAELRLGIPPPKKKKHTQKTTTFLMVFACSSPRNAELAIDPLDPKEDQGASGRLELLLHLARRKTQSFWGWLEMEHVTSGRVDWPRFWGKLGMEKPLFTVDWA